MGGGDLSPQNSLCKPVRRAFYGRRRNIIKLYDEVAGFICICQKLTFSAAAAGGLGQADFRRPELSKMRAAE
jgi:hypothetical protein